MKFLIKKYATDSVGPTRASLDGFWGDGWEVDNNKRVLYNGIDVQRLKKKVHRKNILKKLNIPENAKIVLNVARYSIHKRHEFLIEVAGKICSNRDDIFFILIGDGDLKNHIENIVEKNGLLRYFRFISGAHDIDEYFISSDIFAFPSCNEGFGIVVVEAALFGLPVIAQDIPGVNEAAIACKESILLPIDTSSDEWANTLIKKLDESSLDDRQSYRYQNDFPFTIQKSIDILRQVYIR